MARSRRSRALGGTPEEHYVLYGRLAGQLHKDLRIAQEHFAAGRCGSGSVYFHEALEDWGQMQAHRKQLLYTTEHGRPVSRVQIRFSQRINELRKAHEQCLRQLPRSSQW